MFLFVLTPLRSVSTPADLFRGARRVLVVGVLDGHGGDAAAAYLADNLESHLLRAVDALRGRRLWRRWSQGKVDYGAVVRNTFMSLEAVSVTGCAVLCLQCCVVLCRAVLCGATLCGGVPYLLVPRQLSAVGLAGAFPAHPPCPAPRPP